VLTNGSAVRGGVSVYGLQYRLRSEGVRIKCIGDVREGETEAVGVAVSKGNDSSSAGSGNLLTLPTILTLVRVAAVPALIAVFYTQATWATLAGATIFVLAAITDWLDGYLARRMGTSSEFGAFLDPVADKLMVVTTLVLLCTRSSPTMIARFAPWLLPVPAIAMIGREITMSALREWAASQGGDIHKAVAVNNLGKWKTATQMVALTLLLASRDGGGGAVIEVAGVSLLYVAAGLALWSLAVYIKAMWKQLAN